jgi:ornithine cyclodeaminase/alanine dehydrogenase-like protein (mu-crystallin family)
MTLLLSKPEVSRHLVMSEMIDQMEAGFVAFANGEVEMPQRVRLATIEGRGYGAFMPCYMPNQGLAIKINTNFRENPSRYSLPRILGLLVLLDTGTGVPLAIMDSTAVTACRTAAVSGVAMRHLAREDAKVLGVLGTGALSLPHVQAASAVRPIRLVRLYSPHLSARRAEFARAAQEVTDARIDIAESAEEVVSDADILVTCTSSVDPVLEGKWIPPHACVIAVGNATPSSRELDSSTIIRSRVICDSCKACILESGDLRIPLREKSVTDDHITEDLGVILKDRRVPDRTRQGIVLFKSVGLAFEDLIAARSVYSRAIASGTGTSFDFFNTTAAVTAN